jgi:hypothetical protein
MGADPTATRAVDDPDVGADDTRGVSFNDPALVTLRVTIRSRRLESAMAAVS